jgi:hypothetical protein
LFRHNLVAILAFMDRVWPKTTADRTFAANPPLNQAIADFATAQHGVAATSDG